LLDGCEKSTPTVGSRSLISDVTVNAENTTAKKTSILRWLKGVTPQRP